MKVHFIQHFIQHFIRTFIVVVVVVVVVVIVIIIIIIIIIIIDKTAFFLNNSLQVSTVFYYLGFRNRAKSSALRPTPNLKDHVSVFMSPSDRVTQLYPQAPGTLFVAFHDSHGCGGDILTLLHTEDLEIQLHA
jgi:hypothetical protein